MESYSSYFLVLFNVCPVLFPHDVCTVAYCSKGLFSCQALASCYENSMKCHWLYLHRACCEMSLTIYLHCGCSWILLLSKNGLPAWDFRCEFVLLVNFPFLLKLMVNLPRLFGFFVYFHCAWGVRDADVLIMNYAYF